MIYISYNDKDKASADYLSQVLRQRNISTWMVDDLVAGAEMPEALREMVSRSRCLLFCLGSSGVSERQESELAHSIAAEKWVLPLLLPGNIRDDHPSFADAADLIDFGSGFKDPATTKHFLQVIAGTAIEPDYQTQSPSRSIEDHPRARPARKAVNVAVVNRGRLLLVQRAETQKSGSELWQLPGGKVQAGEDNQDAALRELREEVGLNLDASQLIFVREFVDRWIMDATEDYFVMALFVCFTPPAAVDVAAEFKSHKWIALHELFDEKSIIYFSATAKYLQYVRRFIFIHLPLREVANHLAKDLEGGEPLPKQLAGISHESTAVVYAMLSLLGFVSDRGDFYAASTLSHQLIRVLAEWSLTDAVIFNAVAPDQSALSLARSDDAAAVARFKEGLFERHSHLLGLLSTKLPKALSSRRVASLLIFGRSRLRSEQLLLVRWDFWAQKYQIPSKGLEEIETDIKDVDTAKAVVAERFEQKLVKEFDYTFFLKTEFQRLGAGSLGLVTGDAPMLRNYRVAFFKLSPKAGSDNLINRTIDEINRETIGFLESVGELAAVPQRVRRELRFYMWVAIDRLLLEPTRIVGEPFQGFADLLDRVPPAELLAGVEEVDVLPMEVTPITFTAVNDRYDHRVDLREKYANHA